MLKDKFEGRFIMLNVSLLVNHLRSNPENHTFVIDQIWMDFYNSISEKNGAITIGNPDKFMRSVNNTLKCMDTIVREVKNTNCNLIWAIIFDKIKNIALSRYIWIVDKKFLNLEYRYSPIKISVSNLSNEVLDFMNLKPNFTKAELMRSYRLLCLKYHPDKKGDIEKFRKLQVYKQQLEPLAK